MLDTLRRQPLLVRAIWGLLAAAFVFALVARNWSLAFVAVSSFTLSLLPVFFANRFGLTVPKRFFAAIVAFSFATIFLGEAFDFYERYWWWDVILHTGSAVGFGLLGFLFVLMLFEGDKYAAPPWAVALFAFCFAVTIGTLWEIFEFAMDVNFGLNMQKSGLVDTMWDLIVDSLGASAGAFVGFLYLKGVKAGALTLSLKEFVTLNRRFYRRARSGAHPDGRDGHGDGGPVA